MAREVATCHRHRVMEEDNYAHTTDIRDIDRVVLLNRAFQYTPRTGTKC